MKVSFDFVFDPEPGDVFACFGLPNPGFASRMFDLCSEHKPGDSLVQIVYDAIKAGKLSDAEIAGLIGYGFVDLVQTEAQRQHLQTLPAPIAEMMNAMGGGMFRVRDGEAEASEGGIVEMPPELRRMFGIDDDAETG